MKKILIPSLRAKRGNPYALQKGVLPRRLLCGLLAMTQVLLISLSLTACGAGYKLDFSKPITLNTTPPEGPTEYRQGWSDGCESGLSATMSTFYLAVGAHQYTLDENLRYDNLYNVAWKYGYNHCGYSMRSMAQYSL
jgi:hypothetical protein